MRRIRTVNKKRKRKEWKKVTIAFSFPNFLIIPKQHFKLFDIIRELQEQIEKIHE